MENIYNYDNLKEIHILKYFPKSLQEKLKLSPEQLIVNQFIIDFKNGYRPVSALAAKIVAKTISKYFDVDNEPLVFIPIPASTKEDTFKRYHYFSYIVSKNCNVIDGYLWVRNWVKSEKKHLAPNHITNDDDSKRWFVDYSKIKGTKVIVFDDICTTGETAATFIQRLEKCGAKVIGEIFLGSTFHLKSHLK